MSRRSRPDADTADSIAKARAALDQLTRLVGAHTLSVDDADGTFKVGSGPSVSLPTNGRSRSWRRTVNLSLLPRSISPESRRHLLYAVVQDRLHPDVRLGLDANSIEPLSAYRSELSHFEPVFRVPDARTGSAAAAARNRDILFPIHASVPAAFETYRRAPTTEGADEPRQTDKGFRGPFVEFFCSDPSGEARDDHLIWVLDQLFANPKGLNALDLALVRSLAERIERDKRDFLQSVGIDALPVPAPLANDDEMRAATLAWSKLYRPSGGSTFRPLSGFYTQGKRLRADVQGVACAPGLSRIERVAMVERLLAYHFSLYMLRLTNELTEQLSWCWSLANSNISAANPFDAQPVRIRFHSKAQTFRDHWSAEYDATMERLNHAYLLLPVLNLVELATQTLPSLGTPRAATRDFQWADARDRLAAATPGEVSAWRTALAFLGLLAGEWAGVGDADAAVSDPVAFLFNAVRTHYSQPDQRRYPRDHHQTVFEGVADSGAGSFVVKRPSRHFCLGDELLFLVVLALFEEREETDRITSPLLTRKKGEYRRRVVFHQLESRLAADLIEPADDAARDDLRASLARLGLLDRLSDAGEASFVRHPIGL